MLINYNQDNGVAREYEDRKRVYRIPEHGVLKTQFTQNYGVQYNDYFYVGSNGERKKLDLVLPPNIRTNERALSDIVIFGIEPIGGGERYDHDTKEFLYKTPFGLTFYVGRIDHVEKAYKIKQDFVISQMKN